MIRLPVLTNWKGENYDSILIIVDWFTKMIYYKLVKITINILDLAKVIINMIARYHSLPDSIITNKDSLFTSKLSFLLCYFLRIKQKLFTSFYSQTNSSTKRQNSIKETYLRVFVNWKQNYWVCFLPMAEFIYNNAKKPILVTRFLSLTVAITHKVFLKKTSIFAPNLAQPIN